MTTSVNRFYGFYYYFYFSNEVKRAVVCVNANK